MNKKIAENNKREDANLDINLSLTEREQGMQVKEVGGWEFVVRGQENSLRTTRSAEAAVLQTTH